MRGWDEVVAARRVEQERLRPGAARKGVIYAPLAEDAYYAVASVTTSVTTSATTSVTTSQVLRRRAAAAAAKPQSHVRGGTSV